MGFGGFIAPIGVTAVAIAFTVLNAATLGVAGMAVAGVGAVLAVTGIGLFAAGVYKNRQAISERSPDVGTVPLFRRSLTVFGMTFPELIEKLPRSSFNCFF
jgi:hypothetical protein